MPDLSFRFDLGRPSLNFVATVGSRCAARQIERLASRARLRDWLVESGMVAAGAGLAVDEDELMRAIALREALYRLVHDVVHRRAPRDADLDLVNAAARAAPMPVPQLRFAGAGEWTCEVGAALSIEQALASIARDAIGLLGGAERSLLRECAGHACDGIYVDRSRGFRRQWCSSKTCGNQARVDRFREREAAA